MKYIQPNSVGLPTVCAKLYRFHMSLLLDSFYMHHS